MKWFITTVATFIYSYKPLPTKIEYNMQEIDLSSSDDNDEGLLASPVSRQSINVIFCVVPLGRRSAFNDYF